ncbi:MAG: glycosyltransferase family 2 protein [Chloroflexi bacterium]|nr:glycosyltransferase family 2 protein [Chloroflexota bacterium]
MPVYNEKSTISEILDRIRRVAIDKEIICVDDASTDGTSEILEEEAKKGDIKLLRHPENRGKGAAVSTGLAVVEGDVAIIQDADLEYDPNDYLALLEPISKGEAQVVYGSRFLGRREGMSRGSELGNSFLTSVANFVFCTSLTDMETCYKVFTAEIARKLKLASPRWGFDPEITARILKMGYRIHEVPISYRGRLAHEGKKIRWTDGFTVLCTLLRYRFFD